MMDSFPLLRVVKYLAWLLSYTSFSPRSCLFSTWAHKRSFSRYRCLVRSCNSSYVLPTPPVSSPCLDANEETYLQVTGSPGCWSLHLCQTNQMWGGEPSELLVENGYWIVVGAKPLHVVDETFCSNPTNDANCRYLDRLTFGALVARCKPTKKKGVRRRCASCLSDD